MTLAGSSRYPCAVGISAAWSFQARFLCFGCARSEGRRIVGRSGGRWFGGWFGIGWWLGICRSGFAAGWRRLLVVAGDRVVGVGWGLVGVVTGDEEVEVVIVVEAGCGAVVVGADCGVVVGIGCRVVGFGVLVRVGRGLCGGGGGCGSCCWVCC